MHSVESLAEDLRRLGVAAGDHVLLRVATRAIGATAIRAGDALIDAALSVVGSDGTIIGLSFSPMASRFKRTGSPVFRPDSPVTTGGFAAAMVARPGAVRSAHPTNSFVAIGRRAHDILAGHDATATSFFPMRRLLELDGKMVLVGCVASSPGFSTVHLVQEDLGLATRTLVRGLFGAYMETPDGIRWFSRQDVSGCSRGFGKLYSHYVGAGKLAVGSVGDAYSILMRCREAYDIERPLLEANPRFPLCDRPYCVSCRGTRTYNLRDLPFLAARFLLSRGRLEKEQG